MLLPGVRRQAQRVQRAGERGEAAHVEGALECGGGHDVLGGARLHAGGGRGRPVSLTPGTPFLATPLLMSAIPPYGSWVFAPHVFGFRTRILCHGSGVGAPDPQWYSRGFDPVVEDRRPCLLICCWP